jgi:23S rRNA pseudouridine1911/1915/1917 synthase
MLSLIDSWTCPEEWSGTRLDKFLAEAAKDVSRSQIQEWIAQDCFLVNNKQVKKNLVLKSGDIITVTSLPEVEPTHLVPENIPLDIIHEDNCLAVINKPKGMVVHPGSGNKSGTLANALVYKYKALSSLNDEMRPGIIHRLDKNTSGLLIVAKTNRAHAHLAGQLEQHTLKRGYQALVWRQMDEESGVLHFPIGRHPRSPVKMAVVSNGKKAETRFKVKAYYGFATCLDLELQTGRTHQIRVHCSHIGHPLIGDPLYGGKPYNIRQLPAFYHTGAIRLQKLLVSQALHAGTISFRHPESNEIQSFSVSPPDDFKEALNLLEAYREGETGEKPAS